MRFDDQDQRQIAYREGRAGDAVGTPLAGDVKEFQPGGKVNL
jgi:hypothetical protein